MKLMLLLILLLSSQNIILKWNSKWTLAYSSVVKVVNRFYSNVALSYHERRESSTTGIAYPILEMRSNYVQLFTNSKILKFTIH